MNKESTLIISQKLGTLLRIVLADYKTSSRSWSLDRSCQKNKSSIKVSRSRPKATNWNSKIKRTPITAYSCQVLVPRISMTPIQLRGKR